jgi:hypothetical protein
MSRRIWGCVAAVFLLTATTAAGKKKEKVLLPDYVLKAEMVFVVILPQSGEPMNEPTANRKAQEEVEKALMKWGRFRLTLGAETADLVIGVRKGTGRAANPTVSGGPVDSRPVTLEKVDGQVRVGGGSGPQPPTTEEENDPSATSSRAHTGMEAGATEDTFLVYQGGMPNPLDGTPIWRYVAKDGLRPPDVNAVEEFHKAVNETEKAAAQRQQKQKGQKTP